VEKTTDHKAKHGKIKPFAFTGLHMYMIPIVMLTFFIIIPGQTSAQSEESVVSRSDTTYQPTHSPQKATLYSMVLPGLGQAYNQKYWKIPVIYTGFAVFTYFIIFNRNEYVKFRDAYDYKTRGDTLFPINNEYLKYSEDQLIRGRDDYRRDLEFTYILAGLWYILNIVDATVDAHLFDYDISDDLSIKFSPAVNDPLYIPHFTPAVTLTYRIGN